MKMQLTSSNHCQQENASFFNCRQIYQAYQHPLSSTRAETRIGLAAYEQINMKGEATND